MLPSFSFRVDVFSSLHIIALVWITFRIQNGLLESITAVSTGKMIRINFRALVGLEVCSLKLFLLSCHFFLGSIRVKPHDTISLICRSGYQRSLSHPYSHCTVIVTTYGYFLNSNDFFFFLMKSYKYLLLKVSDLPILTRAQILQILFTSLPYGNPSRKMGRFLRFIFLFFSVSVKVLPVTPLLSGVFVHRALLRVFS